MSQPRGAPQLTRLCIVRHGETAWNAEHRVQGQLDVPLNDVGRRQALAVADALRGEPFDALYCSDLQRVRQTAAPTAAQLGMEPVIDPALRERHYGIFQTLTYAEVKVRYAEDYARFARRDPEYAFRTGESLRAFAERSVAAIRAIAARHGGQRVLVFTHGGVLDELYRHIGGLAAGAPRDFGIPNCGINRVEIGEQWSIGCWAEVAHLDNALDDLKE